MSRTIRVLMGCFLLSAPTFAQTRPQFEVASIRPSSDQASQVNVGLRITGSQVRFTYLSLKEYIGMAYNVRPFQVSGPEWLAQLRFDIAANIPAGVSPDLVPDMLQSLLADRFQLTMHRESREFPVYALTVARSGLKIKEVPADPDAGDKPAAVNVAATGGAGGVALDLGGGSSFTLGNNRLEVRKMAMGDLAEVMARFLDRPILDQTNVKGRFDLTVDLTPEDYNALLIRSAVNAGVVLPPQALRLLDSMPGNPLSNGLETVGLAIDSRRAPLDVVVVDSMSRTPTDN